MKTRTSKKTPRKLATSHFKSADELPVVDLATTVPLNSAALLPEVTIQADVYAAAKAVFPLLLAFLSDPLTWWALS